MEAGGSDRTDAEIAISREIEQVQRRAAHLWRGMEKAGTIELVRALDVWAVSQLLRRKDSTASEETAYIRVGAAVALQPFLLAVKGSPGGVPWAPSSESTAQFAYSYLICCGKLAHLRRIATLERYGLASTSMIAPGRLLIETRWGLPEMATREALRAWRRERADSAEVLELISQRKRLRERMRSYVETDPRFLIRYDNDPEIVSSYRQEAAVYGSRYFEGEALPADVPIGGRTFGEWKDACDQALGRILCHIDFAVLLHEKHRKSVALRDVLTIFARREDLADVWKGAGLSAHRVQATIDALSLSIDGLEDWVRAHETPTPFYIDLGRDFVLLACFGALMNPYFALFRHLRNAHRAEWDRGVDRREDAFRAELGQVFAPPRYLVPRHGFTLRRSDGSTLTDIDAIILDTNSGTLALTQLKWHDVVGRSLSERESRRRNIKDANRWVERVTSWVDGRSSADVLRALGVPAAGAAVPPVLYVIGRYLARFSGETDQDPRATWLSWPETLRFARDSDASDPLDALSRSVADRSAKFADLADLKLEYRFPGLAVVLHVSSSYR